MQINQHRCVKVPVNGQHSVQHSVQLDHAHTGCSRNIKLPVHPIINPRNPENQTKIIGKVERETKWRSLRKREITESSLPTDECPLLDL